MIDLRLLLKVVGTRNQDLLDMLVLFVSILYSVDGPIVVVGVVWDRPRDVERVCLWSTWVQVAHDLTWEEYFVVVWRSWSPCLPERLAWAGCPWVAKALAA